MCFTGTGTCSYLLHTYSQNLTGFGSNFQIMFISLCNTLVVVVDNKPSDHSVSN